MSELRTHPESTGDDVVEVDMEEQLVVATEPPVGPAPGVEPVTLESDAGPPLAIDDAAPARRILPPPVPPGATAQDAQSTLAHLLNDALAQISALERDKATLEGQTTELERRAKEAERRIQDAALKLEEARRSASAAENRERELLARMTASSGSVEGDSKEVRQLREALEATRANLEDNFQEVATLRVQLRKVEEECSGASGVIREAQDQAAQSARAAAAAAEEATLKQLEVDHLQQRLAAAETAASQAASEVTRVQAQATALAQELAQAHEQAKLHLGEQEGLSARLEIMGLDLARVRDELSAQTSLLEQTQQLLARETDARVALEATRAAAHESVDRERRSAQQQSEALGAMLLANEEEIGRLKAELATAAGVAHELTKAREVASAELTRLRSQAADAEAERKEAMEKLRKADREAKVRAKEVDTLTEEIKSVRASIPPPSAAPPPPMDSRKAEEELTKAQRRLGLYSDEIKRLRAELAAVGKGD